ncbi:MAG: helix-turn-helix domain-containing protein [Bacteroidales bacterium]|nr:helix-turn-helix domain-containing protein [Bacteroidales bacterium]
MENFKSMDEQFLSKVHSIIEQNIGNEDYTVEQLASDVGLSRSMLHRKLIKLSGKNATETITQIRLTRARELLENNTVTVSETAYKVGYKTPSYFNKVFKQHFNVSPGDIKKHALEPNTITNSNQHYIARQSKPSQKRILYLISALLIITGIFLFQHYVWNPVSNHKSLAVLPLENLTGDPDNDYIISGVHDALIGELGQISSLRVISRKSTLRYKESNMLMKDIAGELKVDNIIEGSVVSTGDSIHMIIQVIKVYPREKHLMAENYHDKLSNILKIQASVAKDIASKIKVKITKDELQRITQKRQVNPEVYRWYLRGMYAIHQGNKEWLEKGIEYLQNAIKTDPGEPFAYSALALGYATMGHGQLDSETSFARAVSAANKAIKLDPTIDESYTALSLLYLYRDWNWPLAKKSFENALEVNPNNAVAHAHFAWYHFLFNDMEKSIEHAYQATLIEPHLPAYHAWLGLLYAHNEQFYKAEQAARRALDLNNKAAYAHTVLAWCFIYNKQFLKAIETLDQLPESMQWDTHKVYCYIELGQKEKALEIWNRYNKKAKSEELNACYRGMMAACLGFEDDAFRYLNQAVDQKTYPITYVNYNPCTKPVRDDIRYMHLLKRMNLPWIKN